MAILAIIGLVWVAVTPAATQAPPLGQVQLRSHAVQRHGQDAIEARAGVFDCGVEDLRARLCPGGERYGMSVRFWCQPPGATICPGMITTIGGVERTAFLRPCVQWEVCGP